MTVDPTKSNHPRSVLAFLLRDARDLHKLSRPEVARRVGASIADIEAFESGEKIPDGNAWARYGGSVDQRLRNRNHEYQAAKNSPPQTVVGGAPATRLVRIEIPRSTIVAADVPPQPQPSANQTTSLTPAEAPVPGIAAAQERYRQLHEAYPTFRTRTESDKRVAAAAELIRLNPSITYEQLRRELQAKFHGVAIGGSTYARLRKLDNERLVRAARRDEARANRADSKAAEDIFDAPPSPVIPPPRATTVEEELGAAVDIVLSALPTLASLQITVDEAGNASVTYALREVRVVERTGSLTRTR